MQLPDNGLIAVDKPSGISSFGVVAKVRFLLRQQYDRKIKVGHTGTLDPFASGLMLLVVGDYCKQAQQYSKLDKTYLANIVLGSQTTTYDLEGRQKLIARNQPSIKQIEAVIENFKGKIEQQPPSFSAIKINGQRAYKLARAGATVEMPKRQVEIYQLEIINYNYPNLQLKVKVSSGTYIRSLAVDLGRNLASGGYLSELRRLEVGDFRVDDIQLLVDF